MPLIPTHPSIPAALDDLVVWPDGTFAEREYVMRGEYNHMSDDFIVLAEGTAPWFDFAIANNLL